MIKLTFERWGGTVFKCICGYEKLTKYYYIYMDKLQGTYVYNLIYDICYSLISGGLVKLNRAICRNFEKQQIYTVFFYINYYVIALFLVSILENVGIH